MSDTDPAIAGVQSCGCITVVDCHAGPLDKETRRALNRVISDGGEVRRSTVGELKADPNFLPLGGCPHDPKGWEPAPPWTPRARCKSTHRQDVKRVYAEVYEDGGFHYPAGEVRKWDGKWWATEGWFNHNAPGANDGGEPREETHQEGPFKCQKDAVAWLLPRAVKRANEPLRTKVAA